MKTTLSNKSIFILIFVVGVVLRLLMANTGNYFFLSDEGRDVLVAKQIALHEELKGTIMPSSSWSIFPHTTLYYDLLSSVYRHIPHPILIRYLIALFSSIAIPIAYQIGVKCKDEFSGLLSSTVVATSSVLIGYASHISQVALTPALFSISLYFLIFSKDQQQNVMRTAYLVMSILILTLGLLLHSTMLTVFPIFVVLWGVYLCKYVTNIWLRCLTVCVICMAPIIHMRASTIDVSSLAQIVKALITSNISKPLFEVFIHNVTQFYLFLESGLVLGIGSIYATIVIVLSKSKLKKDSILIQLLGILAGGIFITILLPFEILHNHYFSALYFVALLIFPLLLSVTTRAFVRGTAIALTLLFVIHSLHVIHSNIPTRHSFYESRSIAEAVTQNSFIKNDLPFSIVLPLVNQKGLPRISNWFAGSFWYAIEEFTKKQFVQIVPASESATNINIPGFQDRYVLICIDDSRSSFYQLENCTNDWFHDFHLPLRFVTKKTLSNISYYIFETMN